MIQSTFYAQHNPCRKRKPRKKYIKKQRRQAEAMVAQAAAMTTSSSQAHVLFPACVSLTQKHSCHTPASLVLSRKNMVVVVGLSAWLSTQPLRLRQRRVGLRFKRSLVGC
ncbi:hypothetical protein NC653_016164 [Populus alba x Populus x berolinensis]|uniref:Uncharacterized protein n=1 Tax=Populus alba x Populus x berolinensis TaxID=444605 RepID=A0AAD6VYV6_9ROSI|nr:hypothetical protein NC653_016164 [Populus alba x Populus x berolinensis]